MCVGLGSRYGFGALLRRPVILKPNPFGVIEGAYAHCAEITADKPRV